MAVNEIVLDWIQKKHVRSLLNTPCAGPDCGVFLDRGIERVLGVNIIPAEGEKPHHVIGDLQTWQPDGEWDAAYVNCLFCHNAQGDQNMIAKNIASWPVKYVIVYDTFYDFHWQEHFVRGGLTLLDSHPVDGGVSVVELWSK